ncbi:MAG: hypothetical protein FD123_534 [Bacteroidetes bacterium]|nr:MAG: hypothetical protein FD123_534 [Bacteroidota bacterium]
MRHFLLSLLVVLLVTVTLSRCGADADTFANRKAVAVELLKADCHGLGNAVIEYVKEKGDLEGDGIWAKIGDVAARFLVKRECDCLSEAVAGKLASHYTLAELKALEGKPLSDMTKLPEALIESYSEIVSCVKL